jgi:DNA mismatch repair protein MutS
MAGEELTPMMRQYRRIKAELPEGAILLFRLGDFYEMFFEDAREAAPILGVALTQRVGTPMCGVPYHAVDAYLAKLIRAGKKAAICDQMEDPAQAKGIVRREVTRVVTPGTVTEDEILDATRNNYLAALYAGKELGLALLDLSTGEFTVESVADPAAMTELLKRYAPSECLAGRAALDDPRLQAVRASGAAGTLTQMDDWAGEYDCAYDRLLRHFKVHSLQGYGCEGQAALVCPAGALLHYVNEELRHNVSHIRTLHVRHADKFLTLDENTCVNLDLLPQRGKSQGVTLLGVLNNTRTPMGARLLRAWLARPLRQAAAIETRLDTVECLTRQRLALNDLREKLTHVRDLERLIARIDSGRGNARDAKALAASLLPVPELRERMERMDNALLHDTAARLHPLPELVDLIGRALADEPDGAHIDGGFNLPGYYARLHVLLDLAATVHSWHAN